MRPYAPQRHRPVTSKEAICHALIHAAGPLRSARPHRVAAGTADEAALAVREALAACPLTGVLESQIRATGFTF